MSGKGGRGPEVERSLVGCTEKCGGRRKPVLKKSKNKVATTITKRKGGDHEGKVRGGIFLLAREERKHL